MEEKKKWSHKSFSTENIPYDLELEKIISMIREYKAKRVLLQFPEGLLKYSSLVYSKIAETTDADVYIVGEGSYGACDLPLDKIELLKPDILFHFGHNEYWLQKPWKEATHTKTVYIPARSLMPITKEQIDTLEKRLSERGCRAPLLVSTIQHSHLLPRLKKELEKSGFKPMLKRLPGREYGQILGCDYTLVKKYQKKAECITLLSGGSFHAIGVLLSTQLPVVQVNPYTGKVNDISDERPKILAKRYYNIERAREEKKWAIWIGSKSGQYRPHIIKKLIFLIEKKGKKYYKIVSGKTGPDEILNFGVEARVHVITSCPRIAIDDSDKVYEKILLTPGEAYSALENSLKEYRFPW